jgi:hypothetical protein
MQRQGKGCRLARAPRSSEAALYGSTRSFGGNQADAAAPMLPRKSALALAGAAVVLLGCQVDPGGTAPGGLEPSASSQQSEDPEGPAGSGSGSRSDDSDDGESGGSGSDDSDSGGSGSGGSGSDGGSGGGSGGGGSGGAS